MCALPVSALPHDDEDNDGGFYQHSKHKQVSRSVTFSAMCLHVSPVQQQVRRLPEGGD